MALNHFIPEAIDGRSIGLIVLHFFSICACLKDLKIYVPEAVATGDAVTLSCHYNLENASLYSVRWYLEMEEFYRFVPKESPPSRVFAVAGISVDLTKSGEHTVTLKSVPRTISGKYQCEVSADAPLFHTGSSEAKMLVAELPAHNPVLSVSNMLNNSINEIGIGELLKATCISSPSFPTVNFTWIVNGNIYPSSNVVLKEIGKKSIFDTTNEPEENINEAWSDIIVRIENHMLNQENRKILIRCEINIFNLYRGAVESELKINDYNIWMHGAKVSPTIDQRSSSTSFRGGDPDNSALLSSDAVRLFRCCLNVYLFLLQSICLLVIPKSLQS